MSDQKIGVGIVGLSAQGGWAATAHVPALRSLSEHFEIVGLSGSSRTSAQASAKKHGVPFYTDNPSELASRPEVDLVVIAVKVPHHRELVEAAIDAAKTVYCEWPLGNGLDEAVKLAQIAKDRGVRNFVGLQARSAPPVRLLRDLIAEGRIGEVLSTSVVASAGTPWGGVATTSSAYATDHSSGATLLTIPFGHCIDALSWVLGDFEHHNTILATRRPVVTLSDSAGTVRATSPDQVAVNGILERGSVASVHYRGGFSRGTNFLWEINGTKGDLVVSGGIGHLQFGKVRIQAAFGDDKALSDVAIPDSYKKVAGDPNSLSYTLAHAYNHVLDDLEKGTSQVPDFAAAVQLHRVLEKMEICASA